MALPADVDITSYDTWRSDTMGRGFDVDGQHGYQCWDYGATLWGLTGNYVYPYLSTGGTGYAYGIWSDRELNAFPDFDLITSINDVKRGDMVILDKGRFTGDVSGHNAFADEDYDGSGSMWLVGQNQEDPSPTVGHVVTRDRMSVSKFLGAFRYKAWAHGPGPQPTTGVKKRFPWVLYANKLRSRQRR